ncbi:catalase [Helicobacter sp. 11S02596-1]|uniref:catalase n=1 Tax=Helicobacter sp. 11S02596-1 TaxID=1476194 RepID=UPI000BA7764D|nr:catalase [Helicobacter sp. 11S02596-1]PAF43229.1 hypothetical protein BJI48_05670 [Helicobacter sp. 11S02596-1]
MKTKCVLLSIGLIAGILFAQETMTPEKAADFFYNQFNHKEHPHIKVNHTKGFCATGSFTPREDIKEFVNIPLLNTKDKVLARYSTGGGNPKADDRFSAHGLALKISNDKEQWDFATLNAVINAGKTPDIILKFLSLVGKPDKKDELAALAKKYPSVAQVLAYNQTIGATKSLANTQFNSQHTYKITGADGKIINAKIIFVPQDGIIELSAKEAKKKGPDYLEKDLQKKLKNASVKYYMYLLVANPKDVVDDISAVWENTNKKIFLGTLTLEKYTGATCNSDVFLPGILPDGVGAPIDPVFEFRNQTYSITHSRRQ